MKLIFAIALLTGLTVSFFSNGQVIVNGQDLNQLPAVQYIGVHLDHAMLFNHIYVTVDYGQETFSKTSPLRRINRIKDEYGKDRPFHGDMAIFNFLHQNGWQYLNPALDSANYFVFRRRQE